MNSVAVSILTKKGALADLFSFLLLLEIVKELKFLKRTERWWGEIVSVAPPMVIFFILWLLKSVILFLL